MFVTSSLDWNIMNSIFCISYGCLTLQKGKNTTSNSEANKARALRGDLSWTTTFCNLCVEEIEAWNKGIFAALSAKGQSNLVIKFYDETGLNYDKDQLKCR